MTGKDMLKGIQNMDADLIEEAEFGTFQKKQTGFSGRKKLLFVLAATLIMGTMTAAAVYTRWSTTAQTRYNPSQDVKEQAEKSGLSVMLEETKGTENPNEVLSVTDQGITITAVQSIVDNYQAEITFRIEGFDLPEDEDPFVWPTVTIDGDLFFYGAQSGGFYDGTTHDENGKWVYASTGEPVRSRDDEFQSVILDWVADDGSMEYTHYISFQETDGRYMGKEIVFTFNSIDIQGHKKLGPSIPQVEGNWELRWTLTGTGDSISVTPNAKIGDSDVVLLDAQIGQLSLRTRYQVDKYWEGWDELVTLPQGVCGVRMKDGSEHRCVASTYGFENQEKMVYFMESQMFDAILDISQVESLMFHKGWELDANGKPTIQTFYYIPVSRK